MGVKMLGFLLLAAAGWTSGANVLFLSPHTSYSHANFLIPAIKALAGRGHFVTFWNGLRPQEEIENVTQIYSEKLHHYNTNHNIGFEDNRLITLTLTLIERLAQVCNMVYTDPNFDRVLQMRNTTKFDLIVIEGFMNECMLPMVPYFEAPFIYMTGILNLPWLVSLTDSPPSFDHFPVVGSYFSDEMNVLERLGNTALGLIGFIQREYFLLPMVDRMAAQAFPPSVALPRLRDVEANISMFVMNSHFSMNYQFPKSASIVEAGGLHFAESRPLPQDVEDFLNGSGEAGFIVLSFGSILKGTSLPNATRDIFARVFARLPQRVLWKYEDESGIPNLASNIRLFKWLPPYMDILAHPKARLLMTHGGLFSNQEAVYNEVPLIGFPVFGDQQHYVLKAERDGYAKYLDWKTLTDEILYDAISEITSNPKYKERVKVVSELMKDQMDSPVDRVLFWFEYVIRHRGAPHLRTSARHLNIYERHLVDVILILSSILLLLVYAAYRSSRYVYSKMRTIAKPKKVASKTD